jgi:hypothetical protein
MEKNFCEEAKKHPKWSYKYPVHGTLHCSNCKTTVQRGVNAAKNILFKSWLIMLEIPLPTTWVKVWLTDEQCYK